MAINFISKLKGIIVEQITDYKQLVEYLKCNSNSKFDDFNSKIVNSNIATIGCTVPFIRKLAKSVSLDFALSLPINQYVEVDLLHGIVLSNTKLPFEVKSKLLYEFAHTIENWAVCDCSTIKPNAAEKEAYFKFFCELVNSRERFVCRYGVVNLLANYLDDKHIERVFATLGNISIWGEYYVDMAVAWLVATAMAKCRNQTVKYMEGAARSTLNKFAYNRALQKMRDSYRVSDDDKQWTYSLKII